MAAGAWQIYHQFKEYQGDNTIDLDAEGQVTNVAVAQPAGHGFDEAAVAAARQFEFEPAYAGEAAVPVRVTYVYHFVMREAEPGETAREEAPVNFRGRLLEHKPEGAENAERVEMYRMGG